MALSARRHQCPSSFLPGLLILLVLHVPLLVSASSPPPPLPRQSAAQRSIVARASAQAAAAAAGGEAAALALLNATATRRYLTALDDGTGLQHLSAETLLARLRDGLAAAEIVHNFGYPDDGNCGMDVSLENSAAPGTPYFFNLWMLQALGLGPVDVANNPFTEAAETRFFGYTPFANVSAPDVSTAADRPVCCFAEGEAEEKGGLRMKEEGEH